MRLLARRAGVLAALLAAGPAAAYVLPASAAIRKAAEKRATLALSAVEASGTLELQSAALARLGTLGAQGAQPSPGHVATLPARILVKLGGRARLELHVSGAAEAERPFASVRDERLSGQAGLEATPAAAALLRALAAFLGSAPGGDGRALSEALVRRGVRLDETSLGRTGGRVAVVLGGKPGDERPLAWLDKETFLPLRLLAVEGGTLLDVRLIDWTSPAGGNWFPRIVEVWDRSALLLRFTTEKAAGNPRVPDALF